MLSHGIRRAGAALRVDKRGQSTSTASTIAWPTGASAPQAGDVALIFDHADTNFGNPTAVTPSGFTRIGSDYETADVAFGMFYKICDGTETGSLNVMSGGTDNAKILLLLSGKISSVTVNGLVGDYTMTNRTIDPTSGMKPLVVVGVCTLEFSNPTWDSVTSETEGINYNNVALSYKIYNPSDTLASITYNPPAADGQSGTWAFYLELE